MLPGIGIVTANNLWLEWIKSPINKENTPPKSFSEHLKKFKVPAKSKNTWIQFGYTMDEMAPDGEITTPREMISSILGGVYDDYMRSKFTNYDNRIQDLEQLKRYSEQFEDTSEFLGQLALLSGVEGEPMKEAEKKDKSEAITLSSVHQAKGLEWRAVFVIWLTDGMFPNSRVIEEDDEEESGLEEERRLFYVAITRAKDELYLIYPYIWPSSRTGDVMQRPSRFLEDFDPELVEEWEVGSIGTSW